MPMKIDGNCLRDRAIPLATRLLQLTDREPLLAL